MSLCFINVPFVLKITLLLSTRFDVKDENNASIFLTSLVRKKGYIYDSGSSNGEVLTKMYRKRYDAEKAQAKSEQFKSPF